MRVVIKETEYEYDSDYPQGWEFSSGDYFKRPVVIGGYPCFVKRFERKSPASISGWDLLVDLKHRKEQNLARVYDICSVEEKGRRVYYVVYQYLKGDTLDTLISRNISVDLTQLMHDLFSAIASLQTYAYWFADFIEKNIFWESQIRRFILIDLDSAQPATKAPDDNMYGSKDYWAAVFDFYRNQLRNDRLQVADLSGYSLNCLQIIFLILHLKVSFDSDEQQYHRYAETYQDLPAILDEIDPAFRELFEEVYRDRGRPHNTEHAEKAKQLILQKIIPYIPKQPSDPEIEKFVANTDTIERRGEFELSWRVKNATRVELFKNNVFDSRYGQDESRVRKSAVYNGQDRVFAYKLIVYNGDKRKESHAISIRVIDKGCPVIHAFTASTYRVKDGEEFMLQWNVEGATLVEVHRNDRRDSEHRAGETSVTKTAVYDSAQNPLSYKLVAINGDKRTESNTIAVAVRPPVEEHLPLIHAFTASTYRVKDGEEFMLQWNVEGATLVEVHRNDRRDSEHRAGETSVTKTAVYDSAQNPLSYKLVAINGDKRTESNTIAVAVKKRRPVNTKLIGFTVAGLVAAILLIRLLLSISSGSPQVRGSVLSVSPQQVYWRDPITIGGKNFPQEKSGIKVFMNDIPVVIQSISGDMIVVRYHETTNTSTWSWKQRVKPVLVIGADTIRTSSEITVSAKPLIYDSVTANHEHQALNHSQSRIRIRDLKVKVINASSSFLDSVGVEVTYRFNDKPDEKRMLIFRDVYPFNGEKLLRAPKASEEFMLFENIKYEIKTIKERTGAIATPKDTLVLSQDNEIFENVDVKAKIDVMTWLRYLERNMHRYSETAIEKGISPGYYSVQVRFVVERDGTTNNARSLNSPDLYLGKAAEELVRKGPKWKPAIKNGEAVRSYHVQTITFLIKEKIDNSVIERRKDSIRIADSIRLVKKRTEEARQLVSVDRKFKERTFLASGVKDVEVIVSNNSNLLVEEVQVKVSYQDGAGREKKVAVLNFSNISPHSNQTQSAPKGPGQNVVVTIESINFKQ